MSSVAGSSRNRDPLVVFARGPRSLRRKRIRTLAEKISALVAEGGRFCCRLTDDAELRRLNREFLKHDYPTDVLSFSSPSPDGGLGDLAISWERAREQARQFGHPVETEIGILILHGVLHLLGFDHVGDHGRMARAERRWREKLGLPTGLIERTKPTRPARS
jgi:probable rRNA maturation factor